MAESGDVFGSVGNGGAMAGNIESTQTAADAVAAGVAQALAATATAQAASVQFIQEWGAEVLDGHAEVKGPGGGVSVNYGD